MQEVTTKIFWVKRSNSGFHYSLYDRDPTHIEHIGIHLHINAIKSMNISLRPGEQSQYCTVPLTQFQTLIKEAEKGIWQRVKENVYHFFSKANNHKELKTNVTTNSKN